MSFLKQDMVKEIGNPQLLLIFNKNLFLRKDKVERSKNEGKVNFITSVIFACESKYTWKLLTEVCKSNKKDRNIACYKNLL